MNPLRANLAGLEGKKQLRKERISLDYFVPAPTLSAASLGAP
jgi:hypothetical protein